MDRLEQLGSALSQVSIYDIKSYYNQAKNMVLNVSEMEAKVREATNDEPWGASSTLMQEIAQGTFNFQQFNEIMPAIYSRFMDKEARQWREIYKALQLLEYIVKHGSERVVDDARSHLSTIKMLRNFHYIDEKGKDQGINVRNRSKELSELLMDVERIRTERRKAKANRNKYTGTGNDGMSFSGGSSGRYGGFGSDSLGSGSRSYGGGGGGGSYDRDYNGYSGGGYSGGGSSSSGFRDSAPNQRGFDEYDAGNDEVPHRSSAATSTSSSSPVTTRSSTAAPATQSAASKAKEVDLLGFMDDDFGSPASAPAPAAHAEKALPALAAPAVNPLDDGDDEFADFQAAPISPPATATVASAASISSGGLFDVLGTTPAASSVQYSMQKSAQPVQPVQSAFSASTFAPLSPSSGRTSFGSPAPKSPPPMGMNMGMQMNAAMTPTTSVFASSSAGRQSQAKPASSAGGFDDLWNLSLGASKPSTPANNAGGKKSIKDLEKEKAQASIWGSTGSGAGGSFGGLGPSTGATSAPAQTSSSGFDDLLL